MLNTYTINNGTTNEIVINSVAGTLIKSTPNSKIIRFHMNSPLAKMFFDEDTPHRKVQSSYPYTKQEIQVLQVMLCGGDNCLVEYLDIKEPQ